MSCAVLMFHDVVGHSLDAKAVPRDKYTLSESVFRDHVRAVSNHIGRRGIDRDSVSFTVDDGLESAYTLIAPILEEFGFRGYFFVNTLTLDTPGYLSSDRLTELRDRGHVIGTHSHSHPLMLSRLSEEQIRREWATSVEILEDILGEKVRYAAIPGGFFSKASKTVLAELGIETIFTSRPAKTPGFYGNVKIQGRYAILAGDPAGKIASLLDDGFSADKAYLSFRWHALRLVKNIFGKRYFALRKLLVR